MTIIEYDGRPVVVAREFGAFLGYSDAGKALQALISGDWSDDFDDDVDFVLVRNGRLAEFKRVCATMGLDLVDKRAPSLLLLTESGIQLVLARSEKPEGRAFRRWLVSEVIPEYQRTRALPGPAPSAPLPGPAPAPAPRDLLLHLLEEATTQDAAAPYPSVLLLRQMLDAFKGSMPRHVYAALDVALRPVEALRQAPAPQDALDAFPCTFTIPDPGAADPSWRDRRELLEVRAIHKLRYLSGEDLERVSLWLEFRPWMAPKDRAGTEAPNALRGALVPVAAAPLARGGAR